MKRFSLFHILILIFCLSFCESCNDDKKVITLNENSNKVDSSINTKSHDSIISKNMENCEVSPSSQVYNQIDAGSYQTKVLKVEQEIDKNKNKREISEITFSSKPIVDFNKIETPIINTKSGNRIHKKALAQFLPNLKGFEKFVPSVGQSVDVTDFTTTSTTYKDKKGLNIQIMIYDYGVNNDFLGKSTFEKLPFDDAYITERIPIRDGLGYYMWNSSKRLVTVYAYIHNRFYTTIEANNISNIDITLEALKQIDFNSMKNLTLKK